VRLVALKPQYASCTLTLETVVIGGDLVVRRIGYGAMALTGPGGWGELKDRSSGPAVLRRAVELGVQLIDTADSYGPEVSERVIADTLFPYPEDLVICSKGGFVRDGPWNLRTQGRPDQLRTACEGSLRRLRLERIDLYLLHAVDRAVPIEESVGELADLREEGKIRHVGLSNVNTAQIEAAGRIVPIACVENRYSLVDRLPNADAVLALCERNGLAYLPWQPLSKGRLARRHSTIGKVAARHAVTPAEVALAWLLARSPMLVPIPGTSSLEHLRQNVSAMSLSLSEADLAELERFRPSSWDARTIVKRFAPAPVKRAAGRLLANRRRQAG
jgi:pyridoxine 4-dehydrogenase